MSPVARELDLDGLLQVAQSRIRFRADGVPVRSQEAWVRVLGRCVLTPSGCWEFDGHRNADGYGSATYNGRMDKTHRIVWRELNGPITAGMDVCHHCDNPPCCNPADLFLGTHADNNRDRHAKGRTVMPTNGPDFWRAKTHCPSNHPYSGENVRFRKDGRRYCGECSRRRSRAYQAARRTADRIGGPRA